MKSNSGLPATLQPGRQLVTTTRPDPAKRAELLAEIKARDLVRETPAPRQIPPTVPQVPSPWGAVTPVMAASAPEQVRMHITCGARGGQYLGHGERRGNVVLLVDCEPLPPGRGNGVAGLLAGAYRLEMADGWVCPFCRVPPQRFWNCNCAAAGGSLHTDCDGRAMFHEPLYCQCGKCEPRHFREVEKVQARGASVAAASPVVSRSTGRR
jgi:hypothetical protein